MEQVWPFPRTALFGLSLIHIYSASLIEPVHILSQFINYKGL